jgi:hypothetical protein
MTPMEKIVRLMALASLSGIYHGLIENPADADYVRRCTATVRRRNGDFIRLLFTRDQGHHSSGWWKNPDYERCLHLSVSFAYPTGAPAPYVFDEAERWAKMFFRDDLRWVWVEPPYSEFGKARDVHHYRLFCDPGWQPLKPRGEVYSKEFTEAGWKSFSEIHGKKAQDFAPPMGYAP